MVKEQFKEYNGIAVGDTVKIIQNFDVCYGRYEDWLDAFGFDKTNWISNTWDNPPADALCEVLGIAKHLDYDDDSVNEYKDILFYVDDGSRKWILSVVAIELYHKTEKTNRNFYNTHGRTKIFTIID